MSQHPGFSDNPEGREVQVVRTVRFERWAKPTERTPNPEVQQVPMQFEAAQVSVVGRATIRGALYAIELTKHDLMALLEVAERLEDQRRAEYAYRAAPTPKGVGDLG